MELVLPRTRSYSSTGLVPYGHSSCRELYELVLGKTQFRDIKFLEKTHLSTSWWHEDVNGFLHPSGAFTEFSSHSCQITDFLTPGSLIL